jgi:hypothetical protein
LDAGGKGWAEHHSFADAFASPKPVVSAKEKWMRRFWAAVVIGLGIEMIGFGLSFIASNREIEGLRSDNAKLYTVAAQAGKEAEKAKQSAAESMDGAEKEVEKMRQSSLVLESNVLALKLVLASVDPNNRPVTTVKVEVAQLEIQGDTSDDQTSNDVELMFGHCGRHGPSMFGVVCARMAGMEPNAPNDGPNRGYEFCFKELPFSLIEFMTEIGETLTPAEVNAVWISFPLKPGYDAKVIGGRIVLRINDVIKEFPIQPQTNSWSIATSLATNGTFVPMTMEQWHSL